MITAELEAISHWTEADGIPVLKFWENPKEFPQTIVMKVSHSQYLKFSKDPEGFMKFVNDNHLFGKPVVFAGPWMSISSVGQRDEPSGWFLLAGHGKQSTMIVAALPELNNEDEKTRWFCWSGHLSSMAR